MALLRFPCSCTSIFLCSLINISYSLHSDLGVHVDGFISNVAHSFVIGATKVCVHAYIYFFPPTVSTFLILESFMDFLKCNYKV